MSHERGSADRTVGDDDVLVSRVVSSSLVLSSGLSYLLQAAKFFYAVT